MTNTTSPIADKIAAAIDALQRAGKAPDCILLPKPTVSDGLVYIASPYSDNDPQVREQRYEAACRWTAYLIEQGHRAISPIAASHHVAPYLVDTTTLTDYARWTAINHTLLDACEKMIVLCLPGWADSRGVRDEINYAIAHGIPFYLWESPQLTGQWIADAHRFAEEHHAG